jgi:hypothetical protein
LYRPRMWTSRVAIDERTKTNPAALLCDFFSLWKGNLWPDND